MKRLLLLVFFCVSVASLQAQRSSAIPRYTFGIELKAGTAFPQFIGERNGFEAVFYPVWGIHGIWANRFREHWAWELGGGLQAFDLQHRTPTGRYHLSFMSPQVLGGIQWLAAPWRGPHCFAKVMTGAQLGYRGTLVESFPDYQVDIVSRDWVYIFVRPELGWRGRFKKRWKKAKEPSVISVGVYFRYQFNGLGTATFFDGQTQTTVAPSGNNLGIYWRMDVAATNRKVRYKDRELPPPPIIYNPRLLGGK